MAFGDVAPIPAANFGVIQLNGMLQGQSIIQRIGYLANVGVPVSAPAKPLAQAVVAQVWTTNLKPLLSSTYTLTSVYAQTGGVGSAAVPTDEHTEAVNEQGTVVGDALPAWVSAGIYFQPSNDPIYCAGPTPPLFERKSFHRFSGLVETQQSNGLLDSATIAAFSAVMNNLLVINASSTFWTARVTRPANTLVGGNDSAFTPLSLGGVRQKLSSMLSRKY